MKTRRKLPSRLRYCSNFCMSYVFTCNLENFLLGGGACMYLVMRCGPLFLVPKTFLFLFSFNIMNIARVGQHSRLIVPINLEELSAPNHLTNSNPSFLISFLSFRVNLLHRTRVLYLGIEQDGEGVN